MSNKRRLNHETLARRNKVILDLLKSFETYYGEAGGSTTVHPSADKALKLVDTILDHIPENQSGGIFSNITSKKAMLYQCRVAGNRSENMTIAFKCRQDSLRVLTKLGEKDAIAQEHMCIGILLDHKDYLHDGSENKADLAIRQVFRHYLAALTYSPSELTMHSATIHVNVGDAYARRAEGSKRSNCKLAVKHLSNALQFFNKDAHPVYWAHAHYTLAKVYNGWPVATTNKSPAQIASTQSALVEKCIVHCESALQVYTSTSIHLQSWMTMKTILVISLKRRAVGDSATKKRMIAMHNRELTDAYDRDGMKESLDAMSEEELVGWHFRMGEDFELREGGDRLKNTEKAIKYYKIALEHCSADFLPELWASINKKLSIVYMCSGIKPAAIMHLNLTLQVWNEQDDPEKWAIIQCDIGLAHRNSYEGDWRDQRFLALHHLNLVLESVVVKENYPQRWAYAFLGAGAVYTGVQGIVAVGDTDKAIYCFSRYLELSNENSEHWARVNHSMALLHRGRTEGNKAENLDKSLEFYVAWKAGLSPEEHKLGMVEFLRCVGEGSLERNVMDTQSAAAFERAVSKLCTTSQDDDPIAWAINKMELASRCLMLYEHEERRSNVEKAIAYCTSAMEVFTEEKFPEKWTEVQMKLCESYLQRVEGTRRDNMEMAMRFFAKCKQVRPDQEFPEEFLKKQWQRGAEARKRVVDIAAAVELGWAGELIK